MADITDIKSIVYTEKSLGLQEEGYRYPNERQSDQKPAQSDFERVFRCHSRQNQLSSYEGQNKAISWNRRTT